MRPIIVHKLEVVDFQQVLICFLVWEYYNFCGIKNLINGTADNQIRAAETFCPLFYFYILCIWISGLQSVFHSEKLIVKVTLVTLSILEKRHRQSSPDI